MYQQLGKLLAKVGKEVIKAATSKTGKQAISFQMTKNLLRKSSTN
jgi:hypothetical protein